MTSLIPCYLKRDMLSGATTGTRLNYASSQRRPTMRHSSKHSRAATTSTRSTPVTYLVCATHRTWWTPTATAHRMTHYFSGNRMRAGKVKRTCAVGSPKCSFIACCMGHDQTPVQTYQGWLCSAWIREDSFEQDRK